jgi:hypothetical protein
MSRAQGHSAAGRIMSMKIPITPSGIDPATFRFAAQCLNHCSTACPLVFFFVGTSLSISSGHLIGYSPECSVKLIICQTFGDMFIEIQFCVAFYRAKCTVQYIAQKLLQLVARRK